MGPDGLVPQFHADHVMCEGHKKKDAGCNDPPPPGDDPETLLVLIKTCNTPNPPNPCTDLSDPWTDEPQVVQAKSGNWLHVWDSGGNGTRGRAKYPGAFSTEIHMQPDNASTCVDEDGMDASASSLFAKLEQDTPLPTVFDFQAGYDIANNPWGFSIFQFRWEETTANVTRTFLARTGFGLSGSNDHPHLTFLGAGDIDDPMATRVFRIKADAKVILEELDKNTVIATLVCDNEHTYEVTVAPNV